MIRAKALEPDRAGAGLALAVAALGLLALATRPVGMAAVVATCLVGVAGSALVSRSTEPRASGTSMLVVIGIGVAAFASIRVALPGQAPAAGVWSAAATGLAGVAEEAFFRGFLYDRLRRWGDAAAVIACAIAFALVHVPLYGWRVAPLDLAAGLLFGWQRAATGTWAVPATTHLAANVMASL